MTANPSATPGPNGFPDLQMIEGGIPPAIGMPNTNVESILAAQKEGRELPGADPFQRDWIAACKGQSNGIVHGTSSGSAGSPNSLPNRKWPRTAPPP